LKRRAAGLVPAGSAVVCVLTGHGLKDPDTAMLGLEKPVEAGAEVAELERVLAG
jgi:threonine synthase